jgi:hypothetical protein
MRPARRVRRLALLTSFAFSFTVLFAAPASANIATSSDWSDFALTGYCGDAAGDYVVGVQSYLQGAGYTPGAIDGEFGTNTYNALFDYQADHPAVGSADGCAGSATWEYMKSTTYYEGQYDCGNGVYPYLWSRGRSSSKPSYFFQKPTNSYWFNWIYWQNVSSSLDSSKYYRMDDEFTPEPDPC